MKIRKYIPAAIIIALIIPPVLAGLWVGLLASFGNFSALNSNTLSLEPWRILFSEPGFLSSIRATLISGFLSTFVSLSLALIGCYWFLKTDSEHKFSRFISPILAAPHSAIAIGLAFLIAPSGWFLRALSPWLTGFETPPQITTNNDALGITLALGLAVKEIPFLFFMALTALRQLPIHAQIKTASALGYTPQIIWLKIIIPQIYRRIKLPIFIVLIFGISNIDMALILGPTHPPTLAVMALQWFHSPQIENIFPACAASMLLLLIAVISILLWEWMIKLIGKIYVGWIMVAKRNSMASVIFPIARNAIIALVFCGIASLIALLLWSFAWRWSFPNILPETFSIKNWERALSTAIPIITTSTIIALASTIISLVIVITWLESTRKTYLQKLEWLFYLPLLIPQIAFLFGLDTLLVKLGARSALINVILAHCLFVLPYALIALQHSWRNIDVRLIKTASALGHSSMSILWRVRMPMMLRPLLITAAISISVSISQYLPTLFVGAGRVTTLTTEAITLSSGSDRRVAGLYALLQTIIPLIVFSLAALLPNWIYHNRKDMHGGTS